jgi:hypothetical protein
MEPRLAQALLVLGSMLRQFFTTLCLLAAVSIAPACDGDSETGAYVDGQTETTDDRAFTATLFHADGEPTWGMNTFYLRVAMPNPNDPTDEGRGVPNLDVDLAAWMAAEDHEMDVNPVVSYEGDGVYRIDGVLLDSAGAWTLDFQMTIGEIVETARFDFQLQA